MNTIIQSNARSNRSVTNQETMSQSTYTHSPAESSLRSSSSYHNLSGLAGSYEEYPDQTGSLSLTIIYDGPDVHDFDESHNVAPQSSLEMPYQTASHSSPPCPSLQHLLERPSGQDQQQERSYPQRCGHSTSEYEPESEDDRDVEEDTGHGSSQHGQMGLLTRSRPQRLPRLQSAHEIHASNFISEEEFLILAEDYLMSLSPKKREKALLTNSMYQKIMMVLLQPKNTQVSTAQFRFWAKRMFTLSNMETHHVVCHDGKPVATKECLYDVLVYCHRKSSHGGRDKTSAEVSVRYHAIDR
ncbi:hypothetical protein BGX34_007894 [Mortierella sp. NVP85]|nr:hypothetical protein BGX34_007894 [Mortierella sp. NVP85]